MAPRSTSARRASAVRSRRSPAGARGCRSIARPSNLRPGHRRREGHTLAAASTLEKDLQGRAEDGRRQGRRGRRRQADRRARRQGRRQGGRVRPRRLHLSRPRQGAGRGCPRRRAELLIFRRRRRQSAPDLHQPVLPEKDKEQDMAQERRDGGNRGRDREERDSEFRRQARPHQSRRQGRQGRPALRLRRARRRRRPEGPRRLRPWQGARSAGGDPQGDGSRQARPDLRAAARGRTLHHDVEGRHGAGKVMLRAAKAGTGIIAGGPMRAVFETLGMHDVVAKSMGSSNPYNMVRATFDALKQPDASQGCRGAARHQVRDAAGSPSATRGRRRRIADAAARSQDHGQESRPNKTVTVEQIGSPIRRPERAARDAGRSRPEQDAPPPHAGGHAGRARHDRQGAAPRPRRRREAEPASRRTTMKLNELRDNAARPRRKRLGRGIGSGTGKTGGRGVKGQKARSGVAINGFEGGQMPLHRRLPKRGFNNIFAKDFNVVSLGRIQAAIDAGKLDAQATIDRRGADRGRRHPPRQGRRPPARRRRTDGEARLRRRRRLEVGDRGGREGRRLGQAAGEGRSLARPQGRVTLRSAGGRAQIAAACNFAARSLSRGFIRPCRPLEALSSVTSGELHGIGRRTTRRQSELRGLRQGRGAQEAHLVHARCAARLSARHLHPDAGHQPAGLRAGVPAAVDRHPRHVQHVLGRRRRAHGDLRPRHHAVHLGLDHHPAHDVGRSVARSAEEGGRAGPQGHQPVHPLRHGAAGARPGLRHRGRPRRRQPASSSIPAGSSASPPSSRWSAARCS